MTSCYDHNMNLLQLVISLSGSNPALRMRIWRQLKTLGASDLRDGVYILPENKENRTAFDRIASELSGERGTAHVFSIHVEGREMDRLKQLFDRNEDYREIYEELAVVKKVSADKRKVNQTLSAIRELRKRFESISAIDFFPGKARSDTERSIVELETRILKSQSSGEPSSALRELKIKRKEDYRNRIWATRGDIWVDRMASAWLIKRFIDPGATIVWMVKGKRAPAKAVGFDFDGAEFTHSNNKVSFEVLLHSFGMEEDVGLGPMARLIHFLDVGGVPVAAAEGLELVLRGLKTIQEGDDALLAMVSPIFDGLYAYYSKENMS